MTFVDDTGLTLFEKVEFQPVRPMAAVTMFHTILVQLHTYILGRPTSAVRLWMPLFRDRLVLAAMETTYLGSQLSLTLVSLHCRLNGILSTAIIITVLQACIEGMFVQLRLQCIVTSCF